MSRFQFVADNSATFEVKRLCELVEIERSSYYAWKAGAPARAARAAADAALVEQIKKIHDEDTTCGAPRITAELNDGVPVQERVNHKRVARVMRENSISGYTKKRRVRTTVPEPADQVVPDLLKRDFTAEAANLRYVGDITYLQLTCFEDEATCRRQVFRWLVRYNTRRRHSWCGYLSPSTYEARRAATLPTAA